MLKPNRPLARIWEWCLKRIHFPDLKPTQQLHKSWWLDIIERNFQKAKFGGEGEIRTREGVAALLAFQASGFNHSPTSPQQEKPL